MIILMYIVRIKILYRVIRSSCFQIALIAHNQKRASSSGHCATPRTTAYRKRASCVGFFPFID